MKTPEMPACFWESYFLSCNLSLTAIPAGVLWPGLRWCGLSLIWPYKLQDGLHTGNRAGEEEES